MANLQTASPVLSIDAEPDEVLSICELRARRARLLHDYANVGGVVRIDDRWGRPAAVLIIFGEKTGRPEEAGPVKT